MITPYIDVRILMRPGDVLAFGGKSRFSRLIKFATRSEVSHVAVVIKSRAAGENLNWMAESSTGGVKLRRVSHAIQAYDGEVWWLPLGLDVRGRFDGEAFESFVNEQDGKPYDDLQCLTEPLGFNTEDFDKFFCSELVTGALKAAKVLPGSVNASRTNPKELCSYAAFIVEHQLKGEPMALSGFNTVRVRQ